MFVSPGQLLVAHPRIGDPFYHRTVLLVIESDEFGTVAIIVNKQSKVMFSDLMAANEEDWIGDEPLYIGGTVGERSLFMVHSGGWSSENTYELEDGICVSSDYEMTEKVKAGDAPEHYKFISGITSWAPMQLETEISRGNNWIVVDADPEIVWEESAMTQWEMAINKYSTEMVGYLFGDDIDF